MNLRLLSKLLGIVALLMGATMCFSLPWAHSALGRRQGIASLQPVEWTGFLALAGSMLICFAVGGLLIRLGRGGGSKLYRKEAMAVVGLSWILATVLGALPFYFCGVCFCPTVRLMGRAENPLIYRGIAISQRWKEVAPLTGQQYDVLDAMLEAKAKGLTEERLSEIAGTGDPGRVLQEIVAQDSDWERCFVLPGTGPPDRAANYRIRWLAMGIADCLFESQSGFSTTGATIIANLEDPELVPHCILFWRSSTHFLGGLGIIVLFVVILGQGSAGKALMRAEMPGPTKEGATARMQHTAWLFAAMYCALNFCLAILLWLLGMTPFDAICHAFGTLATGGFSTYDTSVGHFSSPTIEFVITLFMFLAGTNFTLLFLLLVMRQPGKLLADVEWRTYTLLIGVVTLTIVVLGLVAGDFSGLGSAIRYALFQVVAIMTTTGYGTNDFDAWNNFGRGVLLVLMFIGGCAGSTGGGMKVIRHVLFVKILSLEIEHAFHPRVVRPLWLGGKPVEDQELRRNILVYFGLILILFVLSWLFLVAVEPDSTWGVTNSQTSDKLIDSASAIAATLNNIGPGLGTIGATKNYAYFSSVSKILFVWLMMIGRLEIFAILVLFMPAFWRDR